MNLDHYFSNSLSAPWILIFSSIILRPFVAKAIQRVGRVLRSKPIEEISKILSWLIVPLTLDFSAGLQHFPAVLAQSLKSGSYIASSLLIMSAVRRLILSSMDWATHRLAIQQNLSAGFLPLIRNLITLFIALFSAILILKHFGYDVWSLITALGVGSLAVGLAAKDTLSHMISGFVLIIDRNLKPGDQISFSGTTGVVEEIGLRSTKILTGAGNTWIVPNSELVNTKILNSSIPSQSAKVTTTIKVSLDTSVDRVRYLGTQILSQLEPKEVSPKIDVCLKSILEGNQTLEISFWVSSDSPEVQARLTSQFLEELIRLGPSEQVQFVGAPPPAT